MKTMAVILLLISLALLSFAQEPNPPAPTSPLPVPTSPLPVPPRAAGYLVPANPPAAPETNIVARASAEWELTFEWLPELGSTNAVAYPVRIQVPFEHDTGFVVIRARKVEVRK